MDDRREQIRIRMDLCLCLFHVFLDFAVDFLSTHSNSLKADLLIRNNTMATDPMQGPSTRDLLSLPKAELHLHLEGAMVGLFVLIALLESGLPTIKCILNPLFSIAFYVRHCFYSAARHSSNSARSTTFPFPKTRPSSDSTGFRPLSTSIWPPASVCGTNRTSTDWCWRWHKMPKTRAPRGSRWHPPLPFMRTDSGVR